MTTTEHTPVIASSTALVAQMLIDHALKLSEEPFAGGGKSATELGEDLARQAVNILAHYMLMHPELEEQFPGLAQAATNWDSWQEFGN